MMQRFSSNCNENMVGPCYSCGYYHHGGQANCTSFSMIFSMPNHHIPTESYEDADNMYAFSSSSPSVDCTLSLGPPSSRFNHENEKRSRKKDCMSNFCNWDMLQTNTSSSPSSTHKNHRAGNRSNANNGTDPLLARRCTNCDTTSTPLWRNGPRGPKSLCNACGIRYKKEERRASAAAATNRGGAAAVVDTQHIINGSSSWMHHSAYGSNNEFRFIQEDDGTADVDDNNNTGIYVFPLLASQHY